MERTLSTKKWVQGQTLKRQLTLKRLEVLYLYLVLNCRVQAYSNNFHAESAVFLTKAAGFT